MEMSSSESRLLIPAGLRSAMGPRFRPARCILRSSRTMKALPPHRIIRRAFLVSLNTIDSSAPETMHR